MIWPNCCHASQLCAQFSFTFSKNVQIKPERIKKEHQCQLYCFQKNLLDFEAAEKSKDVENVLKEIRGTARDGLSFLKVVQM